MDGMQSDVPRRKQALGCFHLRFFEVRSRCPLARTHTKMVQSIPDKGLKTSNGTKLCSPPKQNYHNSDRASRKRLPTKVR